MRLPVMSGNVTHVRVSEPSQPISQPMHSMYRAEEMERDIKQGMVD